MNIENNLTNLINKLDPFNMMIYNERDIYQKEIKLIIKAMPSITREKIIEIFSISFFEKIDENKSSVIYDFVISNRTI